MASAFSWRRRPSSPASSRQWPGRVKPRRITCTRQRQSAAGPSPSSPPRLRARVHPRPHAVRGRTRGESDRDPGLRRPPEPADRPPKPLDPKSTHGPWVPPRLDWPAAFCGAAAVLRSFASPRELWNWKQYTSTVIDLLALRVELAAPAKVVIDPVRCCCCPHVDHQPSYLPS